MIVQIDSSLKVSSKCFWTGKKTCKLYKGRMVEGILTVLNLHIQVYYFKIYNLLKFLLLLALPGVPPLLPKCLADLLPHSLDPWKTQKHCVQKSNAQSSRLQRPLFFIGLYLAGDWHRGHGFKASSLNSVLATCKNSSRLLLDLEALLHPPGVIPCWDEWVGVNIILACAWTDFKAGRSGRLHLVSASAAQGWLCTWWFRLSSR